MVFGKMWKLHPINGVGQSGQSQLLDCMPIKSTGNGMLYVRAST